MCPTCGGQGMGIGQLARKFWLRCRSCGIDFSVPVDDYAEAMLAEML